MSAIEALIGCCELLISAIKHLEDRKSRIDAGTKRLEYASRIVRGPDDGNEFRHHISSKYEDIKSKYNPSLLPAEAMNLGHSCREVIGKYFDNPSDINRINEDDNIESILNHPKVLLAGSRRTNIIAAEVINTYSIDNNPHDIDLKHDGVYGWYRKPFDLPIDRDSRITRISGGDLITEHADKVTTCDNSGHVSTFYKPETNPCTDVISVDYALISVLPNPVREGGKIVHLEGCTGIGTEAISKLAEPKMILGEHILAQSSEQVTSLDYYQVLLRVYKIEIDRRRSRHTCNRIEIVSIEPIQLFTEPRLSS